MTRTRATGSAFPLVRRVAGGAPWILASALVMGLLLSPRIGLAQARQSARSVNSTEATQATPPAPPFFDGARTVGAPGEEDPAIGEANRAVRLRQFDKAVAIWRSAAERRNPRAAYHLGVAYRSGRGVPKDLGQAASWFERAVASGDPDAQFALGLLFRSGLGVPRDPARALDLIGKAARAGNRQAAKTLAGMGRTDSIAYAASDPRVALHRLDPSEALAQAIRMNDVGAAREALARGAGVDGPGVGPARSDATQARAEVHARANGSPERPLVLAIELERPELVRLLLEQRANPSLQSQAGEPPLILAARASDPRIVRALLAAGASPRMRSKSGSTALMEAARRNELEIVESLIAAGADPRETLADGSSAADVARRSGFPALALRLRSAGAPVVGGAGSTHSSPAALARDVKASQAALPPIVEAARRGDVSLLRELLARDGALAIRDAEGNAPLHRAADGGHDECVRLLLDAGADPNGRGHEQATPLMRAMASTAEGSERVVGTLLGRGADARLSDANGATALAHAARGATPGKLERLAKAMSGLPPREVEKALERAVVTGSPAVIDALLARVATPEGRLGALCAATVSERDDVFARIVGAGVSLDRTCGDGRSPLMAAVQSGRADRVKRLLDSGADPEFAAPDADSVLIAAAGRGHGQIVALLLAAKAQVNRRGAHRVTALMGAASNGYLEVVRALLAAGADPRMRSETDQTATDFAEAAGHTEVVLLIRARRSGFGSWLGGSASSP